MGFENPSQRSLEFNDCHGRKLSKLPWAVVVSHNYKEIRPKAAWKKSILTNDGIQS